MLTSNVIWVCTVGLWVHQSSDLDDDFQGFDFLVWTPCLLQRLVELFNAVHIVLLGQVQQLPLWALSTHNEQHIHKHIYQQTKHNVSPNETHLLQVVQFLQTSAHLLWHGWAGTGCFTFNTSQTIKYVKKILQTVAELVHRHHCHVIPVTFSALVNKFVLDFCLLSIL